MVVLVSFYFHTTRTARMHSFYFYFSFQPLPFVFHLILISFTWRYSVKIPVQSHRIQYRHRANGRSRVTDSRRIKSNQIKPPRKKENIVRPKWNEKNGRM